MAEPAPPAPLSPPAAPTPTAGRTDPGQVEWHLDRIGRLASRGLTGAARLWRWRWRGFAVLVGEAPGGTG